MVGGLLPKACYHDAVKYTVITLYTILCKKVNRLMWLILKLYDCTKVTVGFVQDYNLNCVHSKDNE